MRQTRAVEISTGFFILLGIGALLILATQTTNVSAFGGGKTYSVTAQFNDIGGLKSGAPVSMAGVKIGRVASIVLDPKTLRAKATLKINSKYHDIPTDTSASILTQGLLGEQYIGLEPGGALSNLKNGGKIRFTQSAVVLEKLIGKFLFNSKSSSKK
jgi:phospholipid/cholesterol/gamma-HCH transport system substrate-binding protein